MFYIVHFDKRELEQTIHCMSHSFPQEPMSQALGIDAKSYITLAEIVCQKAIKEQLSLVAKERKSGDVIGFSICEDLITDIPNFANIDSRFKIIFDLLSKLDEWYLKNYPVKSGAILHLFMTGVDEQHRGKGIAKKLMEETFKVAKNNNYTSIIAECTGVITQHICAKYGFKQLQEIEYKTYVHKGELVFKDIQDHPICKLMIKTLE
jgi:predicted GNAT family acetyltransferase